MTASQATLHLPLMDVAVGAGPTSPLQARPPGARLRAPTPGVAPEWGPGNANPEDVNNLDFVISMIGW